MSFHKLIEVINGDPVQTIREILRIPLENGHLDAFFLPVWTEGAQSPSPSVITSPKEFRNADPFAPVMLCNSGAVAFQEVVQNPNRRIGIVLRPCELRTFLFLRSESGINTRNPVLISMDCMATFPVEDFGWRLDKAQERDRLSKTALHFAAQGGLLPSRYRDSCQLCDKPFPENADLLLELFGIETSEHIGIRSDEDDILNELGMETIVAKSISTEMIERRQRTLDRLLEWRRQSQAYASAHLTQEQKSFDGLIQHLRRCTSCQNTIAQHCPTFELEWVTGSEIVQAEILENWLGYCGGCGMCEHECPEDFPIFKSISYLSRSIGSV
jgi:formate dehydrogenase subunit beta